LQSRPHITKAMEMRGVAFLYTHSMVFIRHFIDIHSPGLKEMERRIVAYPAHPKRP
jgi:hypothetical protein